MFSILFLWGILFLLLEIYNIGFVLVVVVNSSLTSKHHDIVKHSVNDDSIKSDISQQIPMFDLYGVFASSYV